MFGPEVHGIVWPVLTAKVDTYSESSHFLEAKTDTGEKEKEKGKREKIKSCGDVE
jgi:hypothetical protein